MGALKRTKGLRRGQGLARMSVKQRAKFVAAGIHFPSSTIRPREPKTAKKAKMRAVKAGRPVVSSEFDRTTVDAILERDGHACARCGGGLWGDRGRGWSIQHRRARGAGGTQRPDTNAPHNGIALCGSATTGCHGYVEAHPREAEDNGFRVPQNGDPAKAPVNHAHLGPNTYLWPNGSWGSRPWREEACA